MQSSCCCIIPFYNESERLLELIKKLLLVNNLDEIICVDDGSTNQLHLQIAARFDQVKILRQNENLGKTAAIQAGLDHSSSENILLFDADILLHDYKEVVKAMNYFCSTKKIDMLLFARMNDPCINRWLRTNIVISGQRILKKEVLKKIILSKPKRYQIELAINDFMWHNKRQVAVAPLHCNDIYKTQKYGIIQGIRRELEMYHQLNTYKGPWFYFKMLKNFGKGGVS